MLNSLALPAIADGGALAVIRGWDGPTERHITLHKISSTAFATNTALLDQLVRQVEQGILTLRVADVLPAVHRSEKTRRGAEERDERKGEQPTAQRKIACCNCSSC